MAKIVRDLSIEQKNDRCIDGMFVFHSFVFYNVILVFLQFLCARWIALASARVKTVFGHLNGNSKGAGYFHEKQIFKSVLCTTPPDQKDKIRCTFPVIWVQGSCLIKVDSASGSSHGKLSSDLPSDPYCSVDNCNEGSVVDNCPIPWSMGTSHQVAHTTDSNVKQFTKIWNTITIYLFSAPKDK